MESSVKQIATFIQGEVVGDESITVHTLAKTEEGASGAISFLFSPKYMPYLYKTQSSIVSTNKDSVPEQGVKAAMTKVDNVYRDLAKLSNLYEQSKPKRTGIGSRAYVAETARVGKGVYIAPSTCIGEYIGVGDNAVIHPHVTIGSEAEVGNNCIIYINVTVYHDRRIGNRCILHAGCVVGVDGSGFAPTPEGYEKVPQIGAAILEDDVEIRANTCIDRAAMGATIVYSGVKLDNLIQAARNDEIGSYIVTVAQADIAGLTKVGERCMFGGQVNAAGHIHIGNKMSLGVQSGVSSSIKEGSQLMDTPPMEVKSYFKSQSVFRKLSDMYFETNVLRRELDELEKQLNK